MSTFDGRIKEIPYISIDNFNINNRDSDAYFLSHCHSDHMEGLCDISFQRMLLQRNVFIYASEVSCHILKNMYPTIEQNLKKLDMHSHTTVKLRNELISVIPIPAGHCPGSVMFLFEKGSDNILYTGDYRVNSKDLTKFKHFYEFENHLKKIEKIYLDTTFFLKGYSHFPTRDESLQALYGIIKKCMHEGSINIIHLYTPAKYGYEFLFLELYKVLNMPIHLSESAFNIYKYFPNLDKVVTTDGTKTCIHSYWCGCRKTGSDVEKITITARRWRNCDFESGPSENQNNKIFVCYSTHASFEEGSEFIKFLKPKSIEPCVLQSTNEDNLEMMHLIDEHLKEINYTDNNVGENFLFKIEKSEEKNITPIKVNTSEVLQNNASHIEIHNVGNSILDSPPRR